MGPTDLLEDVALKIYFVNSLQNLSIKQVQRDLDSAKVAVPPEMLRS